MQYHDQQYLELMSTILEQGVQKGDRTGTGTLSLFGTQMVFDLSDGTIPLITTKRVHFKSIIYELLWFLSGSTNIKDLHVNGVSIWDEWADKNGELGPGYGHQWRNWEKLTVVNCWDDPIPCKENTTLYDVKVKIEHIDQIAELIDQIKINPNSRRLMVNSWNVSMLNEMKLPPCHYTFQCWVADGVLSLMINQRSCDFFLGVPFNIAQYGILLHMLAHVCNLSPGILTWVGGDTHIYNNHTEQCKLQLSRWDNAFPAPTLKFNRTVTDIFDFKYEDFEIVNYQHHAGISAPVAV